MPTGDSSFRCVRAQARERKLADKVQASLPPLSPRQDSASAASSKGGRGGASRSPTRSGLPLSPFQMEAAELHPGDGLPAAFTNSPLLATPLTPREVAEVAIQGVLESAPMF